jgi:hypothetical protein
MQLDVLRLDELHPVVSGNKWFKLKYYLQQAMEQKGLDIGYQQYQDSMNYPYKQLGFMSDIYRGLPMSQGAQSMYQNPSAISQAVGLGTAGYGAYKMFNSAKGGVIEDQEGDGLDALGMYNAMKG